MPATSMKKSRDVGELVAKVGPISIYRDSYVCYPLRGDGADAINRYTVRIDPEWFDDEGGEVVVDLEPPYYAAKTGNRLDDAGGIIEIKSSYESADEVQVLVIDPASTEDECTHKVQLDVRSNPAERREKE